MTHKFILKVKKFHLSSAKHNDTVKGKPPGGDSKPIPLRVKQL